MTGAAHRTFDACVIGGGPAGSVLAARLAMLGHAVCLVERAAFPRRRLGESLSPGVLPLLEATGAREVVEAAGFRQVRKVVRQWEGDAEVRHDPTGAGLLVDRGRFDALLLQRARLLGVEVLQPAAVRGCRREGGGWRLQVAHGGGMLTLRAALVAHATGRAGAGASGRQPGGPRTLALYGYWRGGAVPEQPRIRAGVDEWFWGVPLPNGSYNTLAFVDAERLRAAPRGAAAQLFHRLVGGSGLMDGCAGARLDGGVRAADATPRLHPEPVGADTIRVGESALALDPLSSSGVQSAIQTSLAAAVVVNTLLRRPESRAAAIRFYREHLARASARHRAWSAALYRAVADTTGRPFWRARADDADGPPAPLPFAAPPPDVDARIELSADAAFEEVPCLDAEFVAVRAALRHPRLDGPVAYVGGREVVPLLRQVRDGMTAQEVARAWSTTVPLRTGLALVGWLLARGVLVPRPAPACSS